MLWRKLWSSRATKPAWEAENPAWFEQHSFSYKDSSCRQKYFPLQYKFVLFFYFFIRLTDLTWEFLPDTASVWRSRQWPTSWSPPRCGTAFPSCPTPHGWEWLRCGSGTTLKSQHVFFWLGGEKLKFERLTSTQPEQASMQRHTNDMKQTK